MASVQHFAFDDFHIRRARLQIRYRFSETASARCRKQHDFFPAEIVAFEKGIDDCRRNVPPNRKTDKDDIVIGDVCVLRDFLFIQSKSAFVYGTAGFISYKSAPAASAKLRAA